MELEQTFPISESSYCKNEEFFLFSTVFEATMLDRKLNDRQVYFELSMGNAGNSLDGHNESHTIMNGEGEEELDAIDATTFNSTTNSCKPISHDRSHYFLPYWDYKQCMDVRCVFPDLRRRLYNSNMIAKMSDKFEEGLTETNHMLDKEDPIAEVFDWAAVVCGAWRWPSCMYYLIDYRIGFAGSDARLAGGAGHQLLQVRDNHQELGDHGPRLR